jgi:hypothetical protein
MGKSINGCEGGHYEKSIFNVVWSVSIHGSFNERSTKMKKHMIRLIVVGCILFMLSGSEIFAGEISLTLSLKTSIPLLDNFGSGTYKANSTIVAGDVLYEGTKIGDYTKTATSTTYTSQEIVLYDIMLLRVVGVSDFVSIRMIADSNGLPSGEIKSQGLIIGASPAFKSLLGLSVIKTDQSNVIKIITP